MIVKHDERHFEDFADRDTVCRSCGTRIIALPADKRKGYCFDCFDPLEVSYMKL